MKANFFFFLIVLSLFAACTGCQPEKSKESQSETKNKPVSVTEYSGHFVNNTYETPDKGAFLVINSFDEFEKIFGSGYVMEDKSVRVQETTFKENVVLAVIKKGLWNYSDVSASCENSLLVLNYKSQEEKSTYEAVTPLIVSVPSSVMLPIKKVVFKENDKEVSDVVFLK
ncbi:MAG: hypothetical protein ACRC2T_16945, partial [Thermoguttaceae bacterium]